MKPVPVEFNPTNVSEVRINTPCLIQGVNVLDALYSLGTPAPVGTSVKSYGPNPVTALSSSVSASIAALSSSLSSSFNNLSSSLATVSSSFSSSLLVLSASISTSMPPGGILGSIQFKDGTYNIEGVSSFLFKKSSLSFYQGFNLDSSFSNGYSHAQGEATKATGFGAHAEGKETRAESNSSHAEGYQSYTFNGGSTLKNGYFAHVEGEGCSACGDSSHAEGQNTSASGSYSHSEGNGTVSNGQHSHAEGNSTRANAQYSHAEGSSTFANNVGSHAEGWNNTTAAGNYSHAEGEGTLTSGVASHAEGHLTVANNNYSHAEGIGTITNRDGQLAAGRYNLDGNTTSLVVIGNGTSDTSRKDAFRVEATGELVLSGGLRLKAEFTNSTLRTMTKAEYFFVVDTTLGNKGVRLPNITDPVKDIGLTVRIQQDDVDGSTATCSISPNPANSSPIYKIYAFGIPVPSLILNYDATGDFPPGPDLSGVSRRSVELTFMGIIGGFGRWQLTGNMAC